MRRYFRLVALFLIVILLATEASAARYVKAKRPTYNPKYASFVVDADTGKILHQENADQSRYPASLTKMMTLYLMFEALNNGRLRMDQQLSVSMKASKMPQTNLYLKPGDTISVREAILALVIRSANDVAVVVAEALAGSEEKFAQIMTQRARQLGMRKTTFRNANGLPNQYQITTAKDMALLAIALEKHYPEYFHFFSRTEFTFGGRTYTSHNRVVGNYPGANGLKTGFINASGFNLVTTASRRGYNLVGVVLGGRTAHTRDEHMMKLLDAGFIKVAQLNGGFRADYPSNNRSSKKYNYAQSTVREEDVAAEAQPQPDANMIANHSAGQLQQTPVVQSSPGILQANSAQKSSRFTSGFVPTPKAKPRLLARN